MEKTIQGTSNFIRNYCQRYFTSTSFKKKFSNTVLMTYILINHIYIALRILLTISMTTATAERSLVKFTRKNYKLGNHSNRNKLKIVLNMMTLNILK
jgi:hypothetical protein